MSILSHHTSRQQGRSAPWTPAELRRVVVRLTGGEVIQVGTAPNEESALALARTVIAEIEEPRGASPLIGERELGSGSIVSVDVLRTP